MWGPPERSLLCHIFDPALSCSVARIFPSAFPIHKSPDCWPLLQKKPSSQQTGAPPSRGFPGPRSIPEFPSSSCRFLPDTGDEFYQMKGHKYCSHYYFPCAEMGRIAAFPSWQRAAESAQSPGLPQPCRRSSPTPVRAGCSSGAGAGRINKVRLCRPGLWPLLTQSTFRSGRNELYQPPPGRADGCG